MAAFDHIHFDCIDSTNTYARQNASRLAVPCLITADMQTGGRGRRGKSFFSPKGTGLYMTLLFSPTAPLPLMTPAAALAVCESLEALGAPRLGIKWVNDVFLGSKKICGILCEHFFDSGKEYIIAGIGINLTTADFPDELDKAGSVSLDIPREKLAEMIAEKLLGYAADPDDSAIAAAYEKRLFFLGKEITFVKDNEQFTAVADGVNDECNLLVTLPNGQREALSSGEISIKI